MLKLETLDGKLTYYRDTRRFGTFKIFHKDNSTLDKKLATLGPDMLNDPPSFDEFVMRLRKKNHWNITKALMDQKVVSGIGNYIKALGNTYDTDRILYEGCWLERHGQCQRKICISIHSMCCFPRGIVGSGSGGRKQKRISYARHLVVKKTEKHMAP